MNIACASFEDAAEEARIAFLENAELEIRVEAELRDREEAEDAYRIVAKKKQDAEIDLKRAEEELRQAEIALAQASPKHNGMQLFPPADEPILHGTEEGDYSARSSHVDLPENVRISLLETTAELDVMRRDACDRALCVALNKNAIIEIQGARFDLTNCESKELRYAIAQAKRAASTRNLVRIAELVAEARDALITKPPQWHKLKSVNVIRSALDDFFNETNYSHFPGADELESLACAIETREAVESLLYYSS